MALIVIDARESGTSTGRYIDKLVEHLYSLKPQYEITVLAKSHRIRYLKQIAPGFEVIKSDFKEFTFAEQLDFKNQIDSLDADLVHFSMVQQPILYKGKVVTTVHDLTMTWENNPSRNIILHKIKQGIYKWVIKKAVAKSSTVITPSEFTKNDVIKFTGQPASKFTVTYEAADSISAKPEPIKPLINQKFIFYIGRPMPHKNLPKLIEAFELLASEHPQLKLVLAGKKDSNYQRIVDMVNKKGIKGVVFTDFISDSELKWLYQNCLAYIFPSINEGFGLPGLEAMVEGAPVISSNLSCLPEVYGNAAMYFDPLDSKSMAEAISKVISNQKLRKSLVEKGLVQASKYSWEKTARETLEVYNRVLS